VAIVLKFNVHTKFVVEHNMAYLLKARTVEPEKEPLLCNGCVTRNNGVTVGSVVYCAVLAEAT
jgi:hypothetical protein